MRKRRTKKPIIILIIILLSCIILLSGYKIYINYQFRNNSLNTEAKIIEIKYERQRVDVRGSGHKYNVDIKFQYEYKIDTKTYTNTKFYKTHDFIRGLPVNLSIGDSITISYLVKIPSISKPAFEELFK